MGLNLVKVDVYYACLINANDQNRIMISKLSTKLIPGCYTKMRVYGHMRYW